MTEPKYTFVEIKEGEEAVSPIRRSIAKTMEVTENFNLFDVLTYIGKLKKAAADKQAEIDGIETMIKAYEDELKLIENELSVQSMETDYQKELARENEEKTKAALKEELLKTGNFVEKE